MLNFVLLTIACVAISAEADAVSFQGKLFEVPSSLPQPKAFFPLTDGSGSEVASWPTSSLVGTCNSSTNKQNWWSADEVFGSVLTCTKNTSDFIVLPSVSYAASGAFSIAFWAKPTLQLFAGNLFEYLYSHTAYGLGNTADTFAPNSINVFLPEQQHPAYGLVRAVVKDADDADTMAFLDSDGRYNNNTARSVDQVKQLLDGQWHFVTLTSRLDGRNGFLLYLDGLLTAQLPPLGNSSVVADGGGPMQLGGQIVLCSRDDVSDDRHYSGRIAHLSLFDTALTTQQVSALYQAVPAASVHISPSPALQNSVPSGLGTSSWLNQYSGSGFLETSSGDVVMCLYNETDTGCALNHQCTALSPAQASSMEEKFAGLPIGVCAQPNGISFPFETLPTPSAFFPLTNYTAAAWPLPDRWFWNNTQWASWAEDDTFKSTVIDCNRTLGSSIALAPFDWGTSGAFAINFWMQQRSNEGEYFQYLMSTRAVANGPINNASIDVYEPNEVHIYLPESRHPAYSLVRTIVKDYNDNYTGPADANFVDSDGFIGSNLPRNTARLNLTDGLWHMVTVTTQPDGSKGFMVYVDGLPMATLEAESAGPFSVSGGDVIETTGNIVLCGRFDAQADRLFDGRISQFSIFNNALTSPAVQTLYNQLYIEPPSQSLAAALTAGNVAAPSPQGVDVPLFPTTGSAAAGSTGFGLEESSGKKGTSEEVGETSGIGNLRTTLAGTSEDGSVSSHKMSGGAIAGIVVGTLAGVVLLSILIALVISLTRRRRMSGVARLQEVPMPELSTSTTDGYAEDQFVMTLNQKVLEAQQRKATAI